MSPFPTLHMALPGLPSALQLHVAQTVASGFLGLGPVWQGHGVLMNGVGTHIHHTVYGTDARQGSFLIPLFGKGLMGRESPRLEAPRHCYGGPELGSASRGLTPC